MAWVEKDHNDHLVSTPCYVQGHQPPDQVAQSHIQPGLECLQGWGTHSLLGQPVPVCHHPLREKLPPNIQPKPPLSLFETIPPCPVTIHPCKQPFPLLFICSLYTGEQQLSVWILQWGFASCTTLITFVVHYSNNEQNVTCNLNSHEYNFVSTEMVSLWLLKCPK